jgi:hypothetical protein
MSKQNTPAVDRALAKVQYDHGCWVFHGSRLRAGYGKIGDDGGRAGRGMVLVHRLMYETFVGPIPPKHDIDHLCRNTSCCNPLHLEAVSRAENVRRGVGWEKGVATAAERAKAMTHCKHGHEFTPENTYDFTTPGGVQKRFCRTCRRIYRGKN